MNAPSIIVAPLHIKKGGSAPKSRPSVTHPQERMHYSLVYSADASIMSATFFMVSSRL